MINNSKQSWEIGAVVKVGFIAGLIVLAKVPTPADYAPDAYVLAKGINYYEFVPHKGISKISQDKAAWLIKEAKHMQEKAAVDAAQQVDAIISAMKFQASVIA